MKRPINYLLVSVIPIMSKLFGLEVWMMVLVHLMLKFNFNEENGPGHCPNFTPKGLSCVREIIKTFPLPLLIAYAFGINWHMTPLKYPILQ